MAERMHRGIFFNLAPDVSERVSVCLFVSECNLISKFILPNAA